MKLGMYVPQFNPSVRPALETAAEAEARGVDGVFVFDHLISPWNPDSGYAQSAIPLASALLSATSHMIVGTLVMRVGVVPDALLYAQLMTLNEMANGRFIAGLGIGDKLSTPENRELDVAMAPRAERLARLDNLARRLTGNGVTVWVGGRSPDIRAIAEQNGAAVNQWETAPKLLQPNDTWAGRFEPDGLVDLAKSGVEWAVCLVGSTADNPKAAVEALSAARPR